MNAKDRAIPLGEQITNNNYLQILFCAGTFIAFFISIIIGSYASKRWLWLSIICAFLTGFLLRFYLDGFWAGVAIGCVLLITLVPSTLLTRFYGERAQRYFKSSGKK